MSLGALAPTERTLRANAESRARRVYKLLATAGAQPEWVTAEFTPGDFGSRSDRTPANRDRSLSPAAREHRQRAARLSPGAQALVLQQLAQERAALGARLQQLAAACDGAIRRHSGGGVGGDGALTDPLSAGHFGAHAAAGALPGRQIPQQAKSKQAVVPTTVELGAESSLADFLRSGGMTPSAPPTDKRPLVPPAAATVATTQPQRPAKPRAVDRANGLSLKQQAVEQLGVTPACSKGRLAASGDGGVTKQRPQGRQYHGAAEPQTVPRLHRSTVAVSAATPVPAIQTQAGNTPATPTGPAAAAPALHHHTPRYAGSSVPGGHMSPPPPPPPLPLPTTAAAAAAARPTGGSWTTHGSSDAAAHPPGGARRRLAFDSPSQTYTSSPASPLTAPALGPSSEALGPVDRRHSSGGAASPTTAASTDREPRSARSSGASSFQPSPGPAPSAPSPSLRTAAAAARSMAASRGHAGQAASTNRSQMRLRPEQTTVATPAPAPAAATETVAADMLAEATRAAAAGRMAAAAAALGVLESLLGARSPPPPAPVPTSVRRPAPAAESISPLEVGAQGEPGYYGVRRTAWQEPIHLLTHGSLQKFSDARDGRWTAGVAAALSPPLLQYGVSGIGHRERLHVGMAELDSELYASWRNLVASGAV